MNSVSLTGRLTDNVELKVTPNGVYVCTFTIAVRRPNVKDTTDFINCAAWRGTAEFISKYFSKGNKIEVTGILTNRKYKDKDGNNRSVVEVVVNTAEFGESKQNEAKPAPAYTDLSAVNFEELNHDEELPF